MRIGIMQIPRKQESLYNPSRASEATEVVPASFSGATSTVETGHLLILLSLIDARSGFKSL